MKKWKIGLGCGLLFFPLFLPAQENLTCKSKLGVEFGFDNFFGEAIIPDRLRASNSEYDYYGYPNANQALGNVYGGVKYEIFSYNNRLGLAAGLRFSQLSSELKPDWNRKYFMWLFRQDETTVDYLTLRSIKQKNYYLGIPVEFRFMLKNNDSFFNHYFKLGIAVNWRLATANSIAFSESAMAQNAGIVEQQIGKPNLFYACIVPVYGVRFGKMKDINVNLDYNFSEFILGKQKHPFIRPDVGFGLQISIQIPLKK